MEELITIITPTYNRKEKIKKLYESLLLQKDKRFKWLVIDDGSTDNTEDFINSLDENEIHVEYLKKNNGGKHTALNIAFENLNTDLACIVDSDDYLKFDAVSEILRDWERYKDCANICGLCYLKKNTSNITMSPLFPYNERVDNYNKYIINRKYYW